MSPSANYIIQLLIYTTGRFVLFLQLLREVTAVFDIMDFVKFNIYAPSLMEDKVLSPLNEQSSVHYYYLLDSIDYWKEGEVYKIRVIPRYRSTQLLEGFFG